MQPQGLMEVEACCKREPCEDGAEQVGEGVELLGLEIDLERSIGRLLGREGFDRYFEACLRILLGA